ncbi:NUDIX domain-containing protein [Nocardioides sp. S-58]|uniref:NUDIX domain-containing protein n=1 Tax=Nocardioides renjunii TaxID=3095075 RepID=A0ABU5KAW0_9ACTN|nr:NUDIX domain-containing protein [Nocardioides sp. S-58]MDZ5661569.1 NUDIX domain-containing protein [Nocardioides sp. S-58]
MTDPDEHAPVAVTVDLVVLTVRDDQLQALTIRRGEEPHRGRWALPGGFLRPDEDLPDAAERELREETGLSADRFHLEQLGSYGAPDRDPRMRTVTVAYIALAADLPTPTAGTDAADARWQPVSRLLGTDDALAFDHSAILADGVERARAKLEYTPLATAFCGEEFTVTELRHVYEVVWGTSLDPRNFHRKVTGTAGFLEPTGATTTRDGGRPAQLFRAGTTRHLHPPLLR